MKGARKVFVPATVIAIALLATSCGKNTNSAGTRSDPGVPGLGWNFENPTGTPVALPNSISIQRVVGADHTDGSFATPICGTGAERIADNEGSGVVDVCITLRNDTVQGENPSSVTQVTLPGGAIFVAKPSTDPAIPKSQNGVLVQSATLSLAEGQSKTFIMRLFCANRAFPPSDRPAFTGDVQTNWEYDTTPIQTDYAPLIEVITLVKDKLITWSDAWTVQNAVWDVTEDQNGLSDAGRASLQGLPPKP